MFCQLLTDVSVRVGSSRAFDRTIDKAPLANALSFGDVDAGLIRSFNLGNTLCTPPY